MSSILKALKKLEQEKTLHEESTGINVSREILKQSSGNRTIIGWLWLLGSSAALVIIILTAALLKKTAPKEAVKSGEQPIARQPALSPAPVQKLPVSPDTAGSVKGTSPAPPVSANEPKLQPSQQSPAETRENPLKTEKITPPITAIPAGGPPKTEPEVKAVPARQASSSAPTLTLSGIAWNKDSADRLAIINGEPTATGANVNGVIVEEILQDRVKLSHNGRIFELLIGRDARIE